MITGVELLKVIIFGSVFFFFLRREKRKKRVIEISHIIKLKK